MPYVTCVERLAKQEGLAEGLAEGELQGKREGILQALEIRFGEVPYSVREAVNRVTSDRELQKLLRAAITARSLDQFTV